MKKEIDNPIRDRVATLNAHHILRRAEREDSRRSERRNVGEGRDHPGDTGMGRPPKAR